MKNRYLLALTLSCWMGYAWTQAPLPGKLPQDAPLLPLCLLDGYQSNTCLILGDFFVPPPFCGSVENNGLLAFIATFSEITFSITPGNCQGTPTGSGIQAQVYGITCNMALQVNSVYEVSPCADPGFETPITLTASNLGYGQVYYLMIDGWSGDCCDYLIEVVDFVPIPPPPSAPPFISGPSTVYTGQTATYSLQIPGGNNVVENTCQNPYYACPGADTCFIELNTITWTAPPGAVIVSSNGLSIEVFWNGTGGEVCAHLNTTCGGILDICLEVEVLPPTIQHDTAYICNGEIFEAYGQQFFAPGSYQIPIDTSLIVQLVLLPNFTNCFLLPADTLTPGNTIGLNFLLIGDSTQMHFLWEGPGVESANANAPNQEVGLPGWYTLTVTDTLTGCSGSDSVEVWFLNSNCLEFQYPIPFSDSLSGAPLFCASNLQPYCSTTAGYTADTIPGVDTLDNGQWFRFEACESEAAFELFAYNCDQNEGVEVALLSDAGAGLMPVYPQQTIANGLTDTLTFSGLTPGATYIFMIDGVNGDLCEFQLNYLGGLAGNVNITMVNEMLSDGYIDGPTQVCPFIPVTYTFVPPVCEWSVTVDGNTSCPIPYQQVCGEAPDSVIWIFPTAYDTVWTISNPGVQWVSDSIGSSIQIWFPDTISTTTTISVQLVPVMQDTIWLEGSCYELCGSLTVDNQCPLQIYSIDVDVIFDIVELPPIGICPGDCVEFCGVTYCGPGTYTCWDSCELLIQEIYLLPPQVTFEGLVEICEGDCFFWNGSWLCEENTYEWVGISASGCDSIVMIEIVVQENQMADLGVQSLCEGDCYEWNGQLFCSPGVFTWSEPDPNGCFVEYQIEIVVTPPEVNDLGTISLCEGGCFEWNGQSFCEAGNFSWTEPDTITGCLVEYLLVIEIIPQEVNDLGTISLCEGGCFEWNGQQFCDPGDFEEWDNSGGGCPVLIQFTIEVFPEIQIELSEPDPLSCNQPEVAISAAITGGSSSLDIQWFKDGLSLGAGLSLNVQEAGTYTLIVEDLATGCAAEGTAVVTGDPEGPTSMQWEENPPLCFGQNTGSILISEVSGGNAPYQYQLNGSIPGDQSIFTGLSPGVQTLVVIDAAGCSLEQTISWDFPEELIVDPGPDLEVAPGTSVTLQPAFNFSPAQVQWTVNGASFSGPELILEVIENTAVSILATDALGCPAEAGLTIQVFEDATIYIPNIFSPNGDGINDYFQPEGGDQVARIRDWWIFDRWGNPIYQQAEFIPGSQTRGWDGTTNGKTCAPGVYIYFLTAEYRNGAQEIVKGDVTLIR